MMDLDLTHVAEELAAEFDTLPSTTVIRVVSDCAEKWPDAGSRFIEEAARSRLGQEPK